MNNIFKGLFKKNSEVIIDNDEMNTQALFAMINVLVNVKDSSELAQEMVNALPQKGLMLGGVVTTYHPAENQLRTIASTENSITKAGRKIIGHSKEYVIDLNEKDNMGVPSLKTIVERKPYYYEDVVKFFSPPMPRIIAQALTKLISVKGIVTYPLIYKNSVLGTVAYFLKDQPYPELSNRDVEFLDSYSSLIAIALDRILSDKNKYK